MNTLSLANPSIPLFFAVALVAGNNLSACVGTLIGSGVIRWRTGILIGVLGYAAGLLIQGSAMVKVSRLLFPSASPTLATLALIVTIIVFMTGVLLRVPISLSMSLVGLIMGISISRHMAIDTRYALTVLAMWFAAPVMAVVAAAASVRVLNATRPVDLWRRTSTFKILLLASSFLAAYVLGANTIGVIVAVSGFTFTNLAIAAAALPVGCYFLSRGGLQRIGREMFSLRYSNAFATLIDSVLLVEAATFLGIPLSNTQTLSSALFGAGIAYKERFLSAKPFLKISAGWVLATLVSFGLGLLI